MPTIDEAIERLEANISDDWTLQPRVDSDDVRAVLAELKRLRTVRAETLDEVVQLVEQAIADGWGLPNVADALRLMREEQEGGA